jgi:YVTN family beta-propeller protein
VRWNGSDRPTTSDGSINGLTAQISASDIAAAGTAVVTVFNPAPGGGSSNPLTFTITTGAVDPQSIAVDPTGKFAYVMSGGCDGGVGGYVSMYTISPTTGVLASIGSPVSTHGFGDYPGSINVDPFGKFAYVTNSGSNDVSVYTIDAATGALASTGTIAAGTDPVFVAVDPSGKFAYVANSGSNDVSMYSIGSTGSLTLIGIIGTSRGKSRRRSSICSNNIVVLDGGKRFGPRVPGSVSSLPALEPLSEAAPRPVYASDREG